MTIHKCTRQRGNSTTRRLKVKRGWYDYQGRQPLKQQSTIAEILLKGKWLAEAGFEINSNVEIQVQQRRIVITSAT